MALAKGKRKKEKMVTRCGPSGICKRESITVVGIQVI